MFSYTSSQIREIVDASKILRRPDTLEEGKPIPFLNYGERSKRIDLLLDLNDGPALVDLRFHIHAPVFDNPETFEAALILSSERVRGIGWHPTGKKRFYGRVVIPRGWHQNVIDPNLEDGHSDRNRHLPLSRFEPTDLATCFAQAARLWHIKLPTNEVLL